MRTELGRFLKRDKSIWVLGHESDRGDSYAQALSFRYEVRHFSRYEDYFSALACEQKKPDFSILELMIGDKSLFDIEFSEQVKSLKFHPFIVISDLDDLDVLRNIKSCGPSDFLVKPINKNEIILKVECLLLPHAIHHVNFSQIDMGRLTNREQQILDCFKPFDTGRSITREKIQESVWKGVYVTPKTLDVHIHNLRKKLQGTPVKIRNKGHNEWSLESVDQVVSLKTNAI